MSGSVELTFYRSQKQGRIRWLGFAPLRFCSALLLFLVLTATSRADTVFLNGQNAGAVTDCSQASSDVANVCTGAYSLADPNGAKILNSVNHRIVGAFPFANASLLVAGVADSPDAGEIATANVHYQILNKRTGQIDSHAAVSIKIAAFALGGGYAASDWTVQAGTDLAPLLEVNFGADSSIVSDSVTGEAIPSAVATGEFVSKPPGLIIERGFYNDFITPTTVIPAADWTGTLHVATGGFLDINEEVNANGGNGLFQAVGSQSGSALAVLDPIVIPLNPDDVAVSMAPDNPDPNAPILTSDEISALTNAGLDLSALAADGLIPSTSSVPEPRSLFIAIAFCLAVLLGAHRSRRVIRAPGAGSERLLGNNEDLNKRVQRRRLFCQTPFQPVLKTVGENAALLRVVSMSEAERQ